MIKDTIFENPLPLLEIKDSRIIKAIDSYLPYSSAFESECYDEGFVKEDFLKIPDIMDVSGGYGEVRFRIPPGLKGLVCLWHISEQLKTSCKLNLGSGNHYHTDMTDVWHLVQHSQICKDNKEWIINLLESWHYKGTYNSKTFGSGSTWARLNELQTLEVRIGEMTFDYAVLVKRIIQCNIITRRLKMYLLEGKDKMRLKMLQEQLKQQDEVEDFVFTDLANEVIKTRIKRI